MCRYYQQAHTLRTNEKHSLTNPSENKELSVHVCVWIVVVDLECLKRKKMNP